jgi:F-type H+-transporting ATPase subunit beta
MGLTGKIVELEDNLEGCDSILNDEFSDTPEKSLYTIGSIDEAVKAEKNPP